MATIGSLIVNVSANLAPLQKGLAKGGKSVQSFAAGISSATKVVAGLGTALAGAFAVQKLIQVGEHLHETAQSMEETALAAQRMGVAVDEYVKLGHAAKMANVEQETLTKSLDIYLKNLGGGKLDKPLAGLGLSASDLKSTDTITALEMIAEKINALPTPAAKAAAATQIFGRAGQQLLPLFEEGSAGIREAAAEAERLGLVFDDVAAAHIMAANDAMDRLSQAGKGLSQTLAITLAPTVENIATELLSLVTGMDGAGGGMDSLAAQSLKLADTVDAAVDSVKIAAKVFSAIVPNLSISGIANLPAALQEAAAYTQSVIAEETPSQLDYKRRVEQARKSQGGSETGGQRTPSEFEDNRASDFFGLIDRTRDSMTTPQEQFQSTSQDLAKLLGVGAISWQEWARGVAEAKKKLDDATGATKAMEEQQEKAQQAIDDAKTPLEKYKEQVTELKTLMDSGLIDNATFDKRIAQMDQDYIQSQKDKIDSPEFQASGALERGSVEAFSAANRSNLQQASAKQTAQNTKDMLAELKGIRDGQQQLIAAEQNNVALEF